MPAERAWGREALPGRGDLKESDEPATVNGMLEGSRLEDLFGLECLDALTVGSGL